MDVEAKQILTKFGEIVIEQDKKLNSVDKLLNTSLSYLSEIIIDQDKKLSSTDQMLNNTFSYLCTNINELNSKISILEVNEISALFLGRALMLIIVLWRLSLVSTTFSDVYKVISYIIKVVSE